nr:MAG TPA: hypothetical protein [Caudoviricetes sp.]
MSNSFMLFFATLDSFGSPVKNSKFAAQHAFMQFTGTHILCPQKDSNPVL